MPVKSPKMTVQFKFSPFSTKAKMVLTFWRHKWSKDLDAIVCDGSVRSGKTLSMIISFVEWSMTEFNHKQFGIAGQSVGSLRKNVIEPMKAALAGWSGMQIKDNRSDGKLTITFGTTTNVYYLYGGKDESSYKKVQGLTASGFFFDEVALQPQSFVNQATTRVDDENGLFWFNCNPAGPYHWFYQDWILDEGHNHNTLHLHFMMDDNLYLTPKVIDRYKRSYSGVFYDRYILGKWVMAEGVVYSNFNAKTMVVDTPPFEEFTDFVVSSDYGDMNPTVFLLWGYHPSDDTWYCVKEYYHDGRHNTLSISGQPRQNNVGQKTDEEYVDDLQRFLGNVHCSVILDPSAVSFQLALRKRGIPVIAANNAVNDGIRVAQVRMDQGKVKFTRDLPELFRELGSYVWDEKAADRGEDKVVKQHDHACITGDTLINTVDGAKPIKNLVGKTGKVYCYDTEKNEQTISTFKDVRKTRSDTLIYELKLTDSSIIKVTGNHKVLTDSGWKKVENLTTDDCIMKVSV